MTTTGTTTWDTRTEAIVTEIESLMNAANTDRDRLYGLPVIDWSWEWPGYLSWTDHEGTSWATGNCSWDYATSDDGGVIEIGEYEGPSDGLSEDEGAADIGPVDVVAARWVWIIQRTQRP